MKFDDQLAAYLYENKSLRLEGIGTFTLDGKVSVPHEHDKEGYYPIEGLSFTYNPKSDTDENLITFLVKRLGKIQPLIRSDLESYLSNIKQFINIGKPYTIKGVGTLSKNNNGKYEFTPGNFLPVKEELHPKRENEEHNYPERNSSSAGRVFAIILIVLAALAALGGIGWGISSLLMKQQQETVEDNQTQGYSDTITQQTTVDTSTTSLANNTTPAQTTIAATDTATTTVATGDSAWYRMTFETTTKRDRAERRTRQLQKMRSWVKYDSIAINDTLQLYRLYLPMKIKMSDTTRIKDSLHIFFGGNIRAERRKS